MPRLTNHRYLDINHDLSLMWHTDPFTYGTPSPDEQWDLHPYFVPYKSLTEAGLIEHRKRISKGAAKFTAEGWTGCGAFSAEPTTRLGGLRSRKGWNARRPTIRVRTGQLRSQKGRSRYAMVNPEIDVKLLARACIAIARLQLAEEKKKKMK
ncbi:MAG TPA: hypothetical protein VFZ48_05305 [Candidatus Saccharimonadales bacterium]